MTDLVGSTHFKQTYGPTEAQRMIRLHNELFLECLRQWRGRMEGNSGDGVFATFDVPSDAVACGLEFLERLRELKLPEPIRVRIGIHMGQAALVSPHAEDNAGVLIGLAPDQTGRLRDLAQPNQILLAGAVFDSARQYVRETARGTPVQWRAHGTYRFTGIEDAVPVFEAGLADISPLSCPPDTSKAVNERAIRDRELLGWRPAIGTDVAHRPDWCLERRLGYGSVGEVWLACHRRSKERRIFKFCFEADRLHALRREVVNFRYLRKALNSLREVAHICDWNFEKPPFFLEAEYVSGGNLVEWADSRGGPRAISLETRLEIVAQIADALAAVHTVGVVHKDIKPSNVLIDVESKHLQVLLTDFGIGLILDRERLLELTLSQIPKAATTMTGSTWNAGTLAYLAPEVIERAPPTTQSDLYALGVILYQAVAGDFSRVLAPGWERDVPDELLREEIASCVQRDPNRRPASAAIVARNLRTLETRRAEREAEQCRLRAAALAAAARAAFEERRRRRRHVTAIVLLVASLVGAGLGWTEIRQLRMAMTQSEGLLVDHVLQSSVAASHWVAEALERELTNARFIVEQLAADEELRALVRDGRRPELQGLLDRLQRHSRGTSLFSLVVADRRGSLLARSPRDESVIGQNFSHRDWFHGGNAAPRPLRATHLSEPFISAARERNALVTVSTPVWDTQSPAAADEPLAVVGGTLRLQDLADWIQRTPVESAGGASPSPGAAAPVVVVLNDRHQLVLHPRNPLLEPNGTVATWPDGAALESRGPTDASFRDPFLRRSFLMGRSPVREHGWHVLVLQDPRLIEQTVQSISRRARQFGWIMVAVAGFAAIVLVGWWVRDHLAGPLPA